MGRRKGLTSDKEQEELIGGKEGEKATNTNNFFSQKGSKNVGAIIELKE